MFDCFLSSVFGCLIANTETSIYINNKTSKRVCRYRHCAVLVDKNSYSRHQYTVFKDFCELAALSMRNAVDRAQYETREARYRHIVKGYKADEVAHFPERGKDTIRDLKHAKDPQRVNFAR